VYVATASSLQIQPHSGTPSSIPGNITAVSASAADGGDVVAYGLGKKVVIGVAGAGKLENAWEVEDNRGEVLAIAFSKDGALLAAGDVRQLI
jgi:hypothetical protein